MRVFESRPRQPRGRLPNFLCLGAQRAGTTTLHMLLHQHPDAYVPAGKELQFFSLHHHRSLSWYASQFAAAESRHIAGEITPYYLFHPHAPGRIAAALPHAKLIVLVRDPVDRVLSGYFHARRHGMEPLPIEAALDAENSRLRGAHDALTQARGRHHSHQWHSYVARSRYETQLMRYLERFPRTSVLLVKSEDLFTNPRTEWTRVQEFLGLKVTPAPEPLTRNNDTAGDAAAVPQVLRARLREALTPTYEAMRRDYAIEWPEPDAWDTRHAR